MIPEGLLGGRQAGLHLAVGQGGALRLRRPWDRGARP